MDFSKYPTSDDAEQFDVDGVHYEFFTTADKSPTIRLSSAAQAPEAMHHSGGAYTESEYIYGDALKFARQNIGEKLNVLSMGLGLGYNEWLTFRELPQVEHLYSFENNPVLREGFLRWLMNDLSGNLNHQTSQNAQDQVKIPHRQTNQFQQKLESTFQHVLDLVGKQDTKNKLVEIAKSQLAKKQFHLLNDLATDYFHAENVQVILFDAFSKKATPFLWDENFLEAFFKKVAAPQCLLATYAATGSLRRSLKKAGFQLLPRPGFQGKRESTFAYRGPAGLI